MATERTAVDRRLGNEEPGRAADEAFDPSICTCDNDCPGFPHCICILIHDEHRCICDCWGDEVVLAQDVAEERKYGLGARVNVCARAASLSRVGVLLARICTADVFVPALEIEKPVTLSMNDVTLEAAIGEAGLIAVDRS
jgi:hypothetical protein